MVKKGKVGKIRYFGKLLEQSARSHFGLFFASWLVIGEVMRSVWMYEAAWHIMFCSLVAHI